MTGNDMENNYNETVECFSCQGTGVVMTFSKPGLISCYRCAGEKVCPKEMIEWLKQGKILKQKRIDCRLTVHRAAKQLDISPALLCRCELGLENPAPLNKVSYEKK